jgi:hypothetical protein
LWLRGYSYFSDCGKSGTVLLQTARVALKFSAISQSRGMMVLHLGDSMDLGQFAVNMKRASVSYSVNGCANMSCLHTSYSDMPKGKSKLEAKS